MHAASGSPADSTFVCMEYDSDGRLEGIDFAMDTFDVVAAMFVVAIGTDYATNDGSSTATALRAFGFMF